MSALNRGTRVAMWAVVGLTLLGVARDAVADPFARPKLTTEELIEGSRKEKALVFYSSIPVKAQDLVVKAFKDKYPWVEVSSIRAGGPVLGQRFYAEKSRGVEIVDVINSGAAEIYPDWRKSGFLARVDNLPEYPGIRAMGKGPDGQYVAFGFVSHPMFWNTKLVKSEEVPDDLWEFTKPKWKDKTATGNPSIGGSPMNWYSWACDCRKQHPAGRRPPSGLGPKWMTAMRENGVLLPGQVGPLTNSIVGGQRVIALSQWNGEVVRALEEGAPIDYKYPRQGTMGQHWVGAVNAKAPHPYTARLFLNWLLSAEGQVLLIQKQGFHSAREDVDTGKYFPLKKGTLRFEEMWFMDLEAITPEETRNFIGKTMEALTGKAVK